MVLSFKYMPTKLPFVLIYMQIGIEFNWSICRNYVYIFDLYFVVVGKSYVYGSQTSKNARSSIDMQKL